jgi:hypothetical protein
MTPCPYCDQAAVVDESGCCIHCGTYRQDLEDEEQAAIDALGADAIEEAMAGFEAIEALGGDARLGVIPPKGTARRVTVAFVDLRPGDVHDFGTITAVEFDPDPAGRYGYVVFVDGTKSAESATVGIWVD